jgi:ABC-type transport system involved in multi-copper enzyme maturation permease subunit
MPLGPVFNAELLTTARRPRNYVIRFLYGLVILCQVYLSYQSNSWRLYGSGQLSIQEMASFAQTIFNTFAILQAVVILLLTPALVGGAIADEKQRKTLHYLLTSQLSGAEIVIGKLAARLLQVFVLVALGLPVVSLVGLFGGIDYQILLFAYASTCSTIYFLATASILVSVYARRPREAISLLYILEIGWLIVPTILIVGMPMWPHPFPTIASWISPVLDYVAITSPLYLSTPLGWGFKGGFVTAGMWGMGLQVLYGTIFITVAAIRLRPVYRNDGGTRKWVGAVAKIGGKRSWFPRPACGNDAMLWKEMYVSRTAGLTKAVLATMGVALLGAIGYSGYWMLVPAIEEIKNDGYFMYGHGRREFNFYVRGVGTAIYLLWFLGIASSSSSVLSSEREEDQWTSLLTTPLTGREILRAKMIGPIWGLRYVAYLLFLLWGVGLAVGSIHPLGLAACLVEFVVFTWFLSALGTSFSLRSKNSSRALASTMALLIFLNGGYLFCCIPFRVDTPAMVAGCTPYIFTASLLSFSDLNDLGRGYRTGEFVAACVIGTIFYGVAAAGLTAQLFTSFDQIVDRPDRINHKRTSSQRREYLDGSTSKEISYIDDLS